MLSRTRKATTNSPFSSFCRFFSLVSGSDICCDFYVFKLVVGGFVISAFDSFRHYSGKRRRARILLTEKNLSIGSRGVAGRAGGEFVGLIFSLFFWF